MSDFVNAKRPCYLGALVPRLRRKALENGKLLTREIITQCIKERTQGDKILTSFTRPTEGEPVTVRAFLSYPPSTHQPVGEVL